MVAREINVVYWDTRVEGAEEAKFHHTLDAST